MSFENRFASSQTGNCKSYSFQTLRGVILPTLGYISICNLPSLHTSSMLLSSLIYILSLEIFYTTVLYKLLPWTSPRGVCFSNTFPSWKTSVSQCYYSLEHGLRKQIFSIARHPTTYMLWASRQIRQGSSTTSFSGAYLSYSHITHEPTFVTKPWARREHSHSSTVSLALEFEGMLKYSHSSHPST